MFRVGTSDPLAPLGMTCCGFHFCETRRRMKALFVIGLIIVVLGILSFFVPVPHTERHGLDAGDIHVGVNTHHDEMLPPYVGVILIVVGGGLIVAGRRAT